MEKKELLTTIDKMLSPYGFKRKGNYWLMNGNEITKIINLQKSQFGNYFYINYGYILNAIPLNGMMHILNTVTSLDKVERERITALLELDNSIPDKERNTELKEVINQKLIANIEQINNLQDLLTYLKNRMNLNDIPLVVKKYFNLPMD